MTRSAITGSGCEGMDGPRVISCDLNGKEVSFSIDDGDLLIDVLRDRCALTSVKRSCDMAVCGACTVLLDGLPVSSCTTLAYEADGRSIVTVEGLSDGVDLHPIQQAFVDHGSFQCGFCAPGFVLTAKWILDTQADSNVDRAAIAERLDGNICRCTGYVKIVDAIESVISRDSE